MSAATVKTELFAPRHTPALRALFDAASSGCHCRFWQFDGEDNDWLARCATGANRDEMTLAHERAGDDAQGVVASIDDQVVGWLKLSPAPRMNKLLSRRVYRTLSCFDGPRDTTLVIGCLLVHPSARRRGVARALIAGAVRAAATLGARELEAFPRVAAHALHEHEMQMGPVAVYRSLGFEVVDGPDPYPVMRLTLRDDPR